MHICYLQLCCQIELKFQLDQTKAKLITQQQLIDQNSMSNRDQLKLKKFFVNRFIEEGNVLVCIIDKNQECTDWLVLSLISCSFQSSTCSTSTESSQPAANGQTVGRLNRPLRPPLLSDWFYNPFQSGEAATDVVIVESESVEPLAVETPSLPVSSNF